MIYSERLKKATIAFGSADAAARYLDFMDRLSAGFLYPSQSQKGDAMSHGMFQNFAPAPKYHSCPMKISMMLHFATMAGPFVSEKWGIPQ